MRPSISDEPMARARCGAGLALAGLALTLTGCGVTDTAVTAAAGGSSQVREAKDARATEERVKQQVDAAIRLDAEQRRAAEAASQ